MEINQSIENPLGAGTQVGQAESFVYTPNQNVFATIQGALDKNLQLQQDDLKKKEEAKKAQDAKLEKLMLDIQTDPKWDMPVEQLSNSIDDIQNFVVDWRASGKPEDYNFQLALKKKMMGFDADKSMNEKTFDTYSKYMTEATANEKLDQEDVKLWENGIREQKDIKGRYDYIMTQPKPGEYFDILKPFTDYFSKEVQQGRLTKTDEKKQRGAESSVWETRTPSERQRMLRQAGKNLNLTDADGNIRPATEEEFLTRVHEQMKPYYEKTLTASTGGGGLTSQQKKTGAAGVRTGTSQGFSDYVALPTDVTPMQVRDVNQQLISIIPSGVQYMGKPGETKIAPLGGWHIEGKVPGNTQTRTFKDKAEADAWASTNEGGTIAEPEFDEQTNTLTYKTLETVYVPYDWNKTKFQAQYPKIDVVGLAQQYNTANQKGNPTYYQVPLPGADDPRNFQ